MKRYKLHKLHVPIDRNFKNIHLLAIFYGNNLVFQAHPFTVRARHIYSERALVRINSQ